MPRYQVKTDQGSFNVELDKAPESYDRLQSLVKERLAKQLSPLGQEAAWQSSQEGPPPPREPNIQAPGPLEEPSAITHMRPFMLPLAAGVASLAVQGAGPTIGGVAASRL